jgi:hypothetical protein
MEGPTVIHASSVMRRFGVSHRVALLTGAGVFLFNFVASLLVWQDWETQSRLGKVAAWVPIADGVLGFPVRTIDALLTHGVGSVVRVGAQRFDLFSWEFLLNAALWGAGAAIAASRIESKR